MRGIKNAAAQGDLLMCHSHILRNHQGGAGAYQKFTIFFNEFSLYKFFRVGGGLPGRGVDWSQLCKIQLVFLKKTNKCNI